MRKIKYLLIITLIFLLSGCDVFLMDSRVKFEIEDNIKISLSDYDTFDWSTVITVKYNNKIIDFENVAVELIDGEIAVGNLCEHEVSYIVGLAIFSERFFVKIINDEYLIKDIYKADKTDEIDTKGTVSLVNETGLILTDDTGSIYIKKENANEEIIKGDILYINLNIVSNEFLIKSYEKIELFPSVEIPTNINSILDFNYFNQGYSNQTTLLRLEGIINQIDNELVLVYDNINFKINPEAINENEILSELIDQKVILSVWIYKKIGTDYHIILNNVEHLYTENTRGNKPVIKTESNYYSYYNKNNVKNFTSYFTITDDKDGKITPTLDMITGDINNKINIITLKVKDSDNNVSYADIIIEINDYSGIETNESISVIDPNCLPSTGDVNVLVIPINFDKQNATEAMRKNIEKAFFGSEIDTGWESLRSYYQESSYNKLNISGAVTEWFSPRYDSSYYATYKSDDYNSGSTLLMVEALKYFKNKYDYSDFDSNNDGYIDAIYLIYNNDIGGNQTIAEKDFYWAFTYWDTEADIRTYSDTVGYSHVFMGYDFFLEDLAFSQTKIALNCETLIHETGHLLNLDDYYDYDEYDEYSNDGGYCGSDMMDYNFGDHGPFSKIMLDWVNPVEITKSGIYELPAFTTTGVSFVIGANSNFDSIFDEYYLIDFYSFDGLNNLQNKSFFETKDNYAGVRVSHVDASLTYKKGYFPTYTQNNSDSQHKLIRMLEADYKGIFHLNSSSNKGAELSDFYRIGDTFGSSFYTLYKSYKNTPIPFTMKVLEINSNSAKIEIIIK